MKKIFLAILILCPILVSATAPKFIVPEWTNAYKNVIVLSSSEINIDVPTVVEIQSDDIISKPSGYYAIYDIIDDQIIPPHLKSNSTLNSKKYSAHSNTSNSSLLVDDDVDTKVTFDLPQTDSGFTDITIKTSEAIRSNSLNIVLDRYVALPNLVSVKYKANDGGYKTIVSNVEPSSSSIKFPEVYSNEWVISLTYSQPLRISEIILNDLDYIESGKPGLRFLAQPNKAYYIFLNPDNYSDLPKAEGEMPNLRKDEGVIVINVEPAVRNSEYVESDVDDDGIVDRLDNCVEVANADQLDVDGNGRGDACDDFDRDGVINSLDNCVNEPNRRQIDTDGDGIGDECDGEESRITEKYPFLVWFGLAFAILIFVGLYFTTIRGMKSKKEEEIIEPPVE